MLFRVAFLGELLHNAMESLVQPSMIGSTALRRIKLLMKINSASRSSRKVTFAIGSLRNKP
jgi:hypothetical protein